MEFNFETFPILERQYTIYDNVLTQPCVQLIFTGQVGYHQGMKLRVEFDKLLLRTLCEEKDLDKKYAQKS